MDGAPSALDRLRAACFAPRPRSADADPPADIDPWFARHASAHPRDVSSDPSTGASTDDDGWFARARSLPGGLGLGGNTRSGELSRMRSFFYDPADDGAGGGGGDSDADAGARAPHVPQNLPVTAPDDADAIIRLEVLTAPEINWTLLSLYGATAVATVYVVVVAHLARWSWAAEGVIRQSALWEAAVGALRAVLRVCFFALPLLFALRLGTARRVASEQLWTACLLAAGLFCENPLTDVFYSMRTLLHSDDAGGAALVVSKILPQGAGKHHAAKMIISDATYTVVIYVYLLLSAHSYRILNSRGYSRAFYLPKLLAAAAYFVAKIALGFGFRIALGLIPFSRVLLVFFLCIDGRSSLRLVLPVLLTTACDIAFVVWVMREVSLTAAFLARVPYLENRSKQLGFRCFVYQSLMLVSNLLFVSTVLDVSLPREILYESYDSSMRPRLRDQFIQLEPPVGQLALAFVYLTWNLIIAYVNLPPGPIMPYTVSALRNLVVACLPPVLTARHRWPAWVPGHLPREPESDEMSESDGDGQSEAALASQPRRSSSASTLLDPLPALDLDSLTAQAITERVEAAAASAAWRAGIPRGELCPLRYRHRELHESLVEPVMTLPPTHAHDLITPVPPPPLFAAGPMYSGEAALDYGDIEHLPVLSGSRSIPVPTDAAELHRPDAPEVGGAVGFAGASPERTFMPLSQAFSPPPPSLPDSQPRRTRLLTRKNLFVLETQILLANAMYLCYIPGNELEELPRDLLSSSSHPPNLSSFAAGLEEMEEQMVDNANPATLDLETKPSTQPLPPRQFAGRDVPLEKDCGTHASAGLRSVDSMPDVEEPARRGDDDGTFFRVDPVAIAAENGYVTYRHIRHDESNGHAVILVGPDRVIVAFSGTRDAKNWMTNSRLMRVPWDVMFPQFEMEPSDTDPTEVSTSAPGSADQTQNSTPTGGTDPLTRGMFSVSSLRELGSMLSGSAATNLRTPDRSATNRADTAFSPGAMEKETAGAQSSPTSHQAGRIPARSHLRRSVSDNRLAGGTERDPLLREHRRSGKQYGSGSSPMHPVRGSSGDAGHPPQRHGTRGSRRRRPRGRSEIEDVAQSLVQEFVTFGHAKVHLGFAEAYGKLRKRVMGALEELYGGSQSSSGVGHGDFSGPSFERDVDGGIVGVERGSCRGLPLFFTGHSLGGVLATFASYEAARYCKRLGLRRRHDVACTTFGTPMAGNSVFKARYERMVETHWRVEFASDPISKLPSFISFEPLGVRVLLDQAGWLMIDPSLVEVQWWGRLASPLLAQKLHYRAAYLRGLQVFARRCKDADRGLESLFWAFPLESQVGGLFPEV